MNKPKPLEGSVKNGGRVYAGINVPQAEECFVYIGGDNYQDVSQIHLTKKEVVVLSEWLNKVVAWMREAK